MQVLGKIDMKDDTNDKKCSSSGLTITDADDEDDDVKDSISNK